VAAGIPDRPGIDLAAEPEPPDEVTAEQGRRVETHRGGGGLDRSREQGGGDHGRRRRVRFPVSCLGVDPDKGVVVRDCAGQMRATPKSEQPM
jgi:hypothetical protein